MPSIEKMMQRFEYVSDPYEAARKRAIYEIKKNLPALGEHIKTTLDDFTSIYIIDEMRPYTVIAGGCIGSLADQYINGKIGQFGNTIEYGDIDFWLTSIPPKDVRRKQYKYLMDNFIKHTDEVLKKCQSDYPLALARKAFTFQIMNILGESCSTTFESFQIIPTFMQPAKDIVNSFDYQHLMSFYDLDTEMLHITPNQIDAILNKKLIPTPDQKILLDKYVDFDILHQPKLKEILSETEMLQAEKVLARVLKYYNRGYKLQCH